MRAVDHDLEAAQVKLRRKRPLAELHVAPRRIIQAVWPCPTSPDGTQRRPRSISASMPISGCIRQLVAVAIENLMPLSANGLCEAEITNPACSRNARVRWWAIVASAAGQSARYQRPPTRDPASSAASSM